MNKRTWLFESPLLSESNFYFQQEYYSDPEWENTWESTAVFPLDEKEWETVGRLKVAHRSVLKRPTRVLRSGRSSCPPPIKFTNPRIIYGWSQYKRRVEELPPEQQAMLRKVSNEIRLSHQGCQPVRKVQIYGHADWDTPRNPQREKQMSIERAQIITDWLKKDLGSSIAAQIKWDTQGFGATQLKAKPTTEANRRQNRRVEIFVSSSGAATVSSIGRCGVPSELTSTATFKSGITTRSPLRSCGPSHGCKAADFNQPKVCLFAAPDSSEDPSGLALFFGMATRWACKSGAINRKGGVGPEPFRTGNDILLTLKSISELLAK